MTLDDLAAQYKANSESLVVCQLGDLLLGWKENDVTVPELDSQVGQYLRTAWTGDEDVFNEVFRAWRDFRNHAIDRLGGMTMNERLYVFSLMERFEQSNTDAERSVIYHKLLARP